MDFQLTEKQKMIKDVAKNFAQKKVAPLVDEMEQSGKIPSELLKALGEIDLFRIMAPAELGGMGQTRTDYLLAAEELAKVSPSFAWSYVSTMCVSTVILVAGTDEQKKKYLPGLISGEKIGAFAVNETGSGAFWQMTMQTHANENGDNYVIQGTKNMISNAAIADVFLIAAKTGTSPESMGITFFIVEKGTPGFSAGKVEKKMGLNGVPVGELILDNCQVSKKNIIGELGGIDKIVPIYAAVNCIGHMAINIGIADAVINAGVKYTKEREIPQKKTLSSLDGVQIAISEMTVANEAARLVSYKAAGFPGMMPNPFIFMSVTHSIDTTNNITDKAINLFGSYGCTKDYGIERFFRDAKTLSLHKISPQVKAMAGGMVYQMNK